MTHALHMAHPEGHFGLDDDGQMFTATRCGRRIPADRPFDSAYPARLGYGSAVQMAEATGGHLEPTSADWAAYCKSCAASLQSYEQRRGGR